VVSTSGLDEALEVLARLQRSDREHVLALCRRPVARELVVDAVRDDPDLVVRHPQQLDELATRELGRRR
jgi:hypothetical protein